MTRKRITILAVLAIFFLVIGLWGYKQYKTLPVVYCTSIYPDYSVQELVAEAEHIVYGTVEAIEPTQMREVLVSTTLDSSKTEDTLYYPVTPVIISVENPVKGSVSDKIVYYEESGVTETYIQKPEGYQMEQGMDVILFLNESGYGWGSQSVYPVIDNQVILHEKAIGEDTISTTNLSDFLGLINSYKE